MFLLLYLLLWIKSIRPTLASIIKKLFMVTSLDLSSVKDIDDAGHHNHG